jgi:hypothetical protein
MAWEFKYNGTKVRKISNIKIEEGLTEPMAFFTATMKNPSSAERNTFTINHLIGSNHVQIYRNGVLKFGGFLEEITPSGLDIELKGRSYEVLLLDERTSRDVEYINKKGQYIIGDATEGIINKYSTKVTEDTITYEDILKGTIRFNHDNLLKAVAKTCNIKSKNFWVTYSDPNFLLQVGVRGNPSDALSPSNTLYPSTTLYPEPLIIETYYAGKKILVTVERKGVKDLINRQRVFGDGDGINQIQCCVPYVDTNLPDTDRSAGFDGYNADCLHSDASSSQSTYGIMEGKPYIDRSIKSLDEAIETAKTILDEYSNIYKNLSIKFAKYVDLNLGDWIKIIDSKQGVDVTARIKKLVHKFNVKGIDSVGVILYNPFSTTEDKIKMIERDSDTTNTSGQGATNLLELNFPDICDSDTPYEMLFELPSEVNFINRVKLTYLVDDYRAFSGTSAAGGEHKHEIRVRAPLDDSQIGMVGVQSYDFTNYLVSNTNLTAIDTVETQDSHTHGIDFTITKQSASLSDVEIWIDNGSGYIEKTSDIETAIGHSLGLTQEVDIPMASYFSTDGGIKKIKIVPTGSNNGECRITGLLMIMFYMESK